MMLNNPSQMRRSDKKAKNGQNYRISCSEKWKNIIQWSPLWTIFKGKIKNAHLLPE